ncbi:protein translocase subunit SecD [Schaalia sp. ZJ1691]|uniref:protein translocase subunit SecD n=1 Tax=Schaalia sp. ZJ1691 TaxID=2709404 RepID=UPI0013EB9A8B|nr:protein translocase subunit SecD [Schaalia sp. ZJ1691]
MATKKRRPVRSLVVLVITILAASAALVIGHIAKGASLVPSLALDLQGGTQLILTPTATDNDTRAITEDDINEAINIIRQRIDASGVSESEIAAMGSSNIVVSIPGTPTQETLDLIRSSSQMNFRPVLQVAPAALSQAPKSEEGPQSGQAAQSGATARGDQAQSARDAQSGAQSGAKEEAKPSQPVSTALDADKAKELADQNRDGKLSDEPMTKPENASSLAWITEQVLYDFYTLNCQEQSKKAHPEGPADKPFAACNDSGTLKYILGPVTVPGSDLSSANAGQVHNSTGQTTGEWGVDLQFNEAGTKAFAESSKILYSFQKEDKEGRSFFGYPDRNQFAVVLDGKIITAPRMNAIISTGQAQISGNFTAKSATALANQLNFGSLPLNFEVESEQRISATLGSDHLQKGLWSGLVGLLLVVLYLVWQYRGLSIVAAGSLVVATVMTYLTIAILSWTMGYRLSLAGVAGLIVAIGVTTDSFIVYFERIRDEVRDGRPLAAAVEEGWDRAKRTITVSDGVNLVAAVVLYLLAVGGVQGFAFTLGVTTIVDLAVIFLFTHPMMELLVRTKFFGQGHRFSGLDPEHLGAKSALVYAGRGRVVRRGSTGSSTRSATDSGNEDEAGQTLSIAEKRRLERLEAERQKASDTADSGEGDADVDTARTEEEGDEQ